MASLFISPTILWTGWPFLKMIMQGMLEIPYEDVDCEFSSTFSLPILASPAKSAASASMVGPSLTQGPHHGAQKSTRETPGLFSTSVWKFASVNVRAAPAIGEIQKRSEFASRLFGL